MSLDDLDPYPFPFDLEDDLPLPSLPGDWLGFVDRVEYLVTTAMRLEPERRYRTAGDLADELERWLGGLLTNFRTIRSRLSRLEEIEEMESSGILEALKNDRLAAHWLEMSADLTYSYDVVFVQSGDGGRTWSEPLRPHDDGTPTEHGFVSMFADGDGAGLIWLDGRKTVNEATSDPMATGMTLRAASIDSGSGIHSQQLVDDLVCDCCQTDIAISSRGPLAVYRDRTAEEIRDIYITRHDGERWEPGQRLYADNWQIPGCPVNGPSIVAHGDHVAG